MAPRFVGKTSLDGFALLEVNGRPVLDDFERLRDLLRTRAPSAAGLLAEPVGNWRSGAGGVVSWYADAANEPVPLTSLSLEHRQVLEGKLREAMAAMAPLLADPAIGPHLRRALVVPGESGIKAVDGQVLLTDWGMVAAGPGGGSAMAADPLAASPLGRYLPAAGASPSPIPTPMPTGPGRMPPPPPMPVGVAPYGQPARASVWNWWLVPAGVAVGAVFLVLGLWLGSRLIADRLAGQRTTVSLVDEAAARAAIERQKQQNAALERELEERRRALSEDVCKADPAQMPHTGPNRAAEIPPAAAPTPPGGQQFRGTLAELLTQSVVMIIAPQQDGAETGSGFFIAPDIIVTNRHVVEHAQPGKLFVAGGKLTRAAKAEIVTESPSSEIGGLDVAILRVAAVPGVQPLAMSTEAKTLDQVIAAGFPGLTMRGDEAYGRLIEGDASAVPTVIMTDGRISAVQTSPAGLKIMPHTAAVSGGNSGGPLVDSCGRVVGVNTFITADRDQVAHNNYAQKSDALIDFFHTKNIGFNESNGPCVPGTSSPQGPSPSTPSSPTPAPVTPPAAAAH